MLNSGFSPWPQFTQQDAERVREVLLSNRVNYWTGNECRDFEEEFAAWAGTRHAVALANGTLALELALRALDLGQSDEVIVTPRTFLASASCIVNVGARAAFADVDRDTQNISAGTIARALTPRTKAIICVHLAGMPCDMDPIMSLAREHGLKVVEDCAQAHGARYKGRMVGSIGDIGAWSFCQDKIMSTGGEGGMVTTDNDDWWLRMWSYKDHGKSWAAAHDASRGTRFRWLHESFGSNWRMLELQAAIGRRQLALLPEWTHRRQQHAARILATCRQHSALRVPEVPDWAVHAYYKLYVFVRPERLADGWTRDRIIDEIRERGVPSQQGSCSEVYLEKAFDGTGMRPARRLPVAMELGATSLMFLVHPTLSEDEISKTCRAIEEVMRQASRPS